MNNNIGGGVFTIRTVHSSNFRPIAIPIWERFLNWLFNKKVIETGFIDYGITVTPDFDSEIDEQKSSGSLFRLSDLVLIDGINAAFFVKKKGNFKVNEFLEITSVTALPKSEYQRIWFRKITVVQRHFSENTLTP